MTTSSLDRAQHLPRDLALIALAIQAGVTVAGTAAQLIWSPYAEDMRRVYTTAQVLVPMLSSAVLNWVFAALLAWCFARHAIDRHGAAALARPGSARGVFGVVFLLLVLVQGYALTPLFHQAALSYIRNAAGSVSMAGFVFALSSAVQWAVLALVVWFACWLALRRRPDGGTAEAASPAPSSSSPSPRAAIAWIVGVFFVCLQMLMSGLFQGWIGAQGDMAAGALLLGWFGTPLAVLALTFWGAWMGVRGAVQVRPLRAIAASALSFVVLQVTSIVIVVGWLLVASRNSMHMLDRFGMAASFVALAVGYLVLMVMLVRGITRWLYRRYL